MNEKTQNAEQMVEGLIEHLSDKKLTMKILAAKLNEVIRVVNESDSHKPARDSGPKSTRKLDEELARSVLFGDDKDLTVKEVCEKFGLSYGQVYSLREGYTFKAIQKEYENWKSENRKK